MSIIDKLKLTIVNATTSPTRYIRYAAKWARRILLLPRTEERLEQTLEQTEERLEQTEERLEQTGDQLNEINAKLSAIDTRFEPIENHLLAMSSLIRHYKRLEKELAGRHDRIESLIRDLIGQSQYGLNFPLPLKEFYRETQPSQVLNPAKLEAMKDSVKINIGCGANLLHDHINVDIVALPGVDIVSDPRSLPFGDGQLDTIHSVHLIPRFPHEELRRVVLPYWYRLLKSGGKISGVFVDWESTLKGYLAGDYSLNSLREITFGAQYGNDFSYNILTAESIQELLKEAGFREISFPVKGFLKADRYETHVIACK